ncbi:Hypothetical Protein FCC1311_029392 [Hondaea fermentalgiana]|uniref:Uncharacterized protein n=1 Tax=Hondaea fermentalgiana TaxID=2315210 RepID=A0A2R5GAF1_9STRA|nr:Hypothetical Protein FCC1311_029392 [Hondaea fermentalgiana]|eukprot:GBG26718.1 Hypothetical Protein FCC1311_029392 [Hondaea fermentalgiana]
MPLRAITAREKFLAEAREATCFYNFVNCISSIEHKVFQEYYPGDKVRTEVGERTVLNSRPKLVWYADERPVLVHVHKASHSFPLRPESVPSGHDRGNILAYYDSAGDCIKNPVAQIYDYMVVMGLKYGVLSTTEFTWFLRRPNGAESQALEITDAFACVDSGLFSVNMAYTQMLLMAMHESDSTGLFPSDFSTGLGEVAASRWSKFVDSESVDLQSQTGRAWWLSRSDGSCDWVKENLHAQFQLRQRGASRKRRAPGDKEDQRADLASYLPLSAPEFGSLLPLPWSDAYECVAESTLKSVKRLRFPNGVSIMIKTLVARDEDTDSEDDDSQQHTLTTEIAMYNSLRALQGVAIAPLVYGGFVGAVTNAWQVVATIDLGARLDHVDTKRRLALKPHARESLKKLHSSGYLHGDVALRNFVAPESSDRVFIIDLETSRLSSEEADFEKELDAFESLF